MHMRCFYTQNCEHLCFLRQRLEFKFNFGFNQSRWAQMVLVDSIACLPRNTKSCVLRCAAALTSEWQLSFSHLADGTPLTKATTLELKRTLASLQQFESSLISTLCIDRWTSPNNKWKRYFCLPSNRGGAFKSSVCYFHWQMLRGWCLSATTTKGRINLAASVRDGTVTLKQLTSLLSLGV